MKHVAVIGASLAGLRAAETLRQHDFGGQVTVVGDEPHRPYDRPPLSKRVLSGEWEPDRIHLRQPDSFDDLDVTWRFGTTAVGLDPVERRVDLHDGTSLDVDGVVVATGAAARRLPDQDRFDHVHVLRSLDDSLRLREVIAHGDRRVVVVGAGFIGLEVAAVAAQLGNRVTVLEGGPAPLVRGLGEQMGAAVADLHRARGVDVRCGVQVQGLTERGVQLAGEHVDADVVLVGIGVSPCTDWLAGSGIQVRDGVVCDDTLQVLDERGSPVPRIYAAGDVARWTNPLFDEEMRVEHWTNAAEQGALAASNLLATGAGAEPLSYAPVPFFWSDQFDLRIQFLGRSAPDDEVVVAAGSIADGKLLALYGRNGRLHGAFGLNAPRWVMPMRSMLLARAGWDEAVAHAATLT